MSKRKIEEFSVFYGHDGEPVVELVWWQQVEVLTYEITHLDILIMVESEGECECELTMLTQKNKVIHQFLLLLVLYLHHLGVS